jgi:fimbrial chaperone protein
MNRRAFALAGLLAALTLTASSVGAKGNLQVRPTLIELPPKKAAGRIVLANTGDEPMLAQVRVYAWTQQEGEDRLAASDQIVLSPPLVKIAPGGEQVVRFVRQGTAVVGQDQSYRLIVEELPNAKTSQDTTVSIRLRYVMPLFVRAAGASPVALTCRLLAASLSCTNTGGQAAQLGRTQLVDHQGRTRELSAGLFGYVLPGSLKQWPLDPAHVSSLGADLRLETQLNGKPFSVPVVLSP